MSEFGTNRTNGSARRCPLIGVDRKWLAEGQSGVFDPELNSQPDRAFFERPNKLTDTHQITPQQWVPR